jgi:hypothetical protein
MVRDNRVKEERFTKTINAATTGSYYSDYPMNGKLFEIDYSCGVAGSLTISSSGTGETIYTTIAVSGASQYVKRPNFIQHYSDGTIVTGSMVQPFALNDKLKYVITGAASGTKPWTINVRYI